MIAEMISNWKMAKGKINDRVTVWWL